MSKALLQRISEETGCDLTPMGIARDRRPQTSQLIKTAVKLAKNCAYQNRMVRVICCNHRLHSWLTEIAALAGAMGRILKAPGGRAISSVRQPELAGR